MINIIIINFNKLLTLILIIVSISKNELFIYSRRWNKDINFNTKVLLVNIILLVKTNLKITNIKVIIKKYII